MEEKNERRFDLSILWHNFLRVLPRLFWLPLVLALGLGLWRWHRLSSGYSPIYAASSTYRVKYTHNGSMDINNVGFYLDSNAASSLASAFPYVISSDRAVALLNERTGRGSLPASVTCRSEATLLVFEATGSDPDLVYEALQTAAAVFPEASDGILFSFTLESFEEAERPGNAVNWLNIRSSSIKYGLLGLGLGLAVIAMFAYFRKTVHNSEDLYQLLSTPCIGILPAVRFKARTKQDRSVLLTNPQLQDSYGESVRGLRLRLLKELEKQPGKVIMITSTSPGEGKSTVSANLALTLADSGSRVALVDCDLRKQTLKDLFGIQEPSLGLVDLIPGRNRTPVQQALVPVADTGVLLLSGDKIAQQPQNFLSSPNLRAIMNELQAAVDYVIVDTPPSGLLSDAATLSEWVDGVIYVVRQDYLGQAAILDSVQRLSETEVRFIGSVINQAERSTSRSGYGYGYGYGYSKGYGYGYGRGYGYGYGYGRGSGNQQDGTRESSAPESNIEDHEN